MNIIIVGCGKMGYALAKQLTDEGHEITMIDTNGEKLERACASLDANGVLGNGTVYSVLLEAGIKDADIFIAVTKYDETNLLSCVIAKKASKCHTIARVKSPAYYDEISFLREELGISFSFNPELLTAHKINNLIHIPSALEIDTFAKDKITLIKLQVPEDSILHNMTLKDLSTQISNNVLVCAVERNKEVLIPSGNFVLNGNDIISLTIPLKETYKFFSKIGVKAKKIKNVVIAGGDMTSFYLASILIKNKVSVKIIEPDKALCEELSISLPEAMIINGNINDTDLLLQENVPSADAIIALSESDEENIVLSLLAKNISQGRIITKINRSEFYTSHNFISGTIVCPRDITSEALVGYVRSLNESKDSNFNALYKLFDNRAEAIEFLVNEGSTVIGTPLHSLNLKNNLLICNITRGNQIIKPRGADAIYSGDTVVVVTTHKGLDSIDDILAD